MVNSILDEKFKAFSEDINKIGQDLNSVTTPINELNRFLGGNVTTLGRMEFGIGCARYHAGWQLTLSSI